MCAKVSLHCLTRLDSRPISRGRTRAMIAGHPPVLMQKRPGVGAQYEIAGHSPQRQPFKRVAATPLRPIS
ncbi:hypothetical protein AWB67_07676 [Caballeronia terrestris]|uniref:Uncharacterized protein n=1 Tax=Caballeronia terrestris TaxID=1226301 RepID=A0A158L6A9_9BURK|nr:hypothetical protein AWB67_07676 [Caballeronia terrestris]